MNQVKVDFYLDISKFDSNFFVYETDILRINPEDVIADSLMIQSLLFNSAAYCLITSIVHMQECIKKCLASGGEQETNIALMRYAFREVCINSETYLEKVKTFTRYYFYICDRIVLKKNRARYINTNEWLDALEQFSSLNQPFFDKFLFHFRNLMDSASYKLIKKIRDDEIHNESPLFLRKIDFDKDCSQRLKLIDHGYVISNDEVLNNIQLIIKSLANIRNSLQEIVSKTDPFTITEFINSRKKELKMISPYSKRYERTRDFIKRYNIESSN